MMLLYAILAGLAGTAAMTAFLYLLSYATRRALKVTKILGTMLTNSTQPGGSLSNTVNAVAVGIAAHYSIGALCALVYLALWDSGVGLVSASWGLLFGLAHGIVAMAGWYFFFMLHPRPPLIPLRTYLAALVFAHLIFGFVTAYTFHLFSQPAYTFWQ